MYHTLKFTDSCNLHSSILSPLYHKVMIPGLCFGFKNCMKLFIIQQRQALVPSNVLKVAFSKYVLTELRHFYLIALLCQARIPRFLCQTCFLTRDWLAQITTTNRIISSQALIIIRSKRNIFIIRNQNKRISSLNLVANFKNFNINLLLWRVVTTVSVHRLADSPGKRI